MARNCPKKRNASGTRYPRRKARRRNRPAYRWKLFCVLALILAAAFFQWSGAEDRPEPEQPARPPSPTPAPPPLEVAMADSFIGRVSRVGDGDTLQLLLAEDGPEIRVRLYGLDAPELDQPQGREARDFLARLVLDQEVRVEKQEVDQYGRVVGRVFSSGLSVNLTLVASGQAWVYEQFCQEPVCRQMRAEEASARRKKLGLWAQDRPQPPWQWRQSQRGRSE